MTTQHIETLIIGAGQAGLSTGYHLQRLRPGVPHPRRQRPGRRQLAPAVGHPAALHARRSTTGSPACRSRATRGRSRSKDEVADYLESYALQCDLPVRMSTRVDRLEPAPVAASPRTLGDEHDHLRQRRRGDRDLRPHAARPGVRRASSTRRSGSCTRASTAGPTSCGRAGAGGRGLALRQRHRLRGSPSTGRRRCAGATPGRSRSAQARARRARPSRCWSSWPPRAHPPYADRTQGDGRGPPPRRPDAPGQARGPRRRGVERLRAASPVSATAGPCSTTAPSWTRRNVVWCTGFRQVFDWIDLPVFGEDGWPRRVPRRRRRGARAVLLRPGLPVRVQLDGAAGRRPGRRVRGRADRRAPRDRDAGSQPLPDGRGPARRILRRRVMRDERRRRPAPGPGGLRAPRLGRGVRRALARRRAPRSTADDFARLRPPPRTCSAATTTASRRSSGPTRRTSTPARPWRRCGAPSGSRMVLLRAASPRSAAAGSRGASGCSTRSSRRRRRARLPADPRDVRPHLARRVRRGAASSPLRSTDYGRRFGDADLLGRRASPPRAGC